LMVFSGIAVGATAMAGAGAAGLKIVRPSARSVSRAATVVKGNETITLAGFSASGPSAGLAATSRCEAVKPQAPCIGAPVKAAQFAGVILAPNVDLMVV